MGWTWSLDEVNSVGSLTLVDLGNGGALDSSWFCLLDLKTCHDIRQEQSTHLMNPTDPIPPQHPRTIRHDRDLKGEASPGIVKWADLVGVERDGLANLVPVIGAVGRHAAGRR